MSDIPIGIDLGTTYSCVAVWKNGKVVVLQNKEGKTITPSVVAFTDDNVLIGEDAKKNLLSNPKNTIYDAKRLIGRKFNDKEVQKDIKLWPFKVKKQENSNRPIISITQSQKEKELYPEEISALVLKRMKEIAETYLGKEVINAVVTVPAYFNDSQRQATKDAGRIAGLNVLRIINEPTAAAIAYQLDNQENNDKNILVFDLGGGTFDVSILNVCDGALEVRATNGNTHLGGEDFDNKIMEYCIEEFKNETGVDISKNEKAKRRLKNSCEEAKIRLSAAQEITIDIDNFAEETDLCINLTKSKFEYLCKDYFKECMTCVEETLQLAKLNKKQIDEIVLVGGSTRIPKIQEMIKDFFNKEPNKKIHPDEAVAVGAAYQAASIEDILDDDLEKLVLIDVTPLSLGIAVGGEIMSVIIKRNSTIPINKSEIYETASDYQTSALFQVYQGERVQVKDNFKVGDFTVTNIQKKKAGEVKFKVTFDIDVNSILTITAQELNTNNKKILPVKEEKIKLSDEEIEKKIEEFNQLTQMQKDKDEAVKEKVNLQMICLKLMSTNPKAKEFYDWSRKNPNEKKDVYTQKIKLLGY